MTDSPTVTADPSTGTAATPSTGAIGGGSAALAGVVAAAGALGAGELVVGLAGKDDPSLVSAVGSEFIDRFAGSLKQAAIDLFGHNDKRALIVGIVVCALAFGALLGLAARRRFAIGAAGFAAFGLLGILAYRSNELGSDGVGIVAAVVAAATGIAALAVLLRLAGAASSAGAPAGASAPAEGPMGAGEPAGAPVLAGESVGAGEPAAVGGPVGEPSATPDDGVRVGSRLEGAPRSLVFPDRMRPAAMARRAFLGTAAAIAGGAALLALMGRRLAGRGASEAARAEVLLPEPSVTVPPKLDQPFSVERLSSYVTPNRSFYRIDTALSEPQVHLDSWRLAVKGMVDHPFEISYADLLALDSVEETVTLSCVSNEVGGDLVGNAVWQGVPLKTLLDRAGVQADASQIVGRSLDGWTAGFPTDTATDGRVALVAYAMNGEPLPVAHGFPARLVVAGLYGYVSATKWLSEIELTTWDAFDGYWIPRGWSKEGPIKTQSRIDVPRPGASLPAGPVVVAGVAWAPSRGIAKVEVQVDDGPWLPCSLGKVQSENTWVQWLLRWEAKPGEHLLSVRATDGDGRTQTSEVAPPDPDGATGWHTRRVNVVEA